jgi:hypothetical protein
MDALDISRYLGVDDDGEIGLDFTGEVYESGDWFRDDGC